MFTDEEIESAYQTIVQRIEGNKKQPKKETTIKENNTLLNYD